MIEQVREGTRNAHRFMAVLGLLLASQEPFAQSEQVTPIGGDNEQTSRSQEELAREAERAQDMFLRDQKVLFDQGEVAFEFSYVGAWDTRNNLQLGSGLVPKATTSRNTLSLLVRYAVLDSLEFSVLLPANRDDVDFDFEFLEPIEGLQERSNTGLGDLQIGSRLQLAREQGLWPDVSVSLNYKADTGQDGAGSGDDSLSIKSTLLKSVDPVVFFLDLGYNHTFAANGGNRGNELFWLFGTGFSVNDRVSYNALYSMRFVEKSTSGGIEINGTEQTIANLQLGLTAQLSRTVFFEPLLSIGLTEDATDVTFGFSVPF